MTIDEIGYKKPNDNDLAWLRQQEFSEEEDHLLFRFLDDEFIRISSDVVELKYQ